MKNGPQRRPIGATILAIILGWLGVAGVLNAVAWPLVRNSELIRSAPPEFVARFPEALGSWWLSVLALAFGISAFVAARALWRLSSSATVAYSVWGVTVILYFVLFSASLPNVPFSALAVVLGLVAVLLILGGLFTRRLVRA